MLILLASYCMHYAAHTPHDIPYNQKYWWILNFGKLLIFKQTTKLNLEIILLATTEDEQIDLPNKNLTKQLQGARAIHLTTNIPGCMVLKTTYASSSSPVSTALWFWLYFREIVSVLLVQQWKTPICTVGRSNNNATPTGQSSLTCWR